MSQPDYDNWVKTEQATLKKDGGALAPSGATS
jgi:hypothetical protein